VSRGIWGDDGNAQAMRRPCKVDQRGEAGEPEADDRDVSYLG
jgi:hypothetical protein